MGTALGFLVIWGVILAIYLTLAVAGMVGAVTAGLVMRVRDAQDATSSRWVGVGRGHRRGERDGDSVLASVGAAAFGWSLAGFRLPPICWAAAAVSAAVVEWSPRAGVAQSSPEKRSQADCRVMPSASPIRAHVTRRPRSRPTTCATASST